MVRWIAELSNFSGAFTSFNPSLIASVAGVMAILLPLIVELREITSLSTITVSALAQNSLRVSGCIGGSIVRAVIYWDLTTRSMISSYWDQPSCFSKLAI